MPKLRLNFLLSKGHTKIHIPSTYYLQEWKSTNRQAPMELRWGFIYLMISLGPVVLIHFLCLNDSGDNCNFQFRTICTSDGSNYVQSSMFDCLKLKIWYSSSITIRWTCLSSFHVCSFEAKNRLFEFYYQQMNMFKSSSFDVR